MNKQYKITVPKPCDENWSAMTPKEKGRFCNSCSKTVIDFTKKTNKEIQEYVIENKNKQVCGHFYKNQLDAITIEIPQEIFISRLPFQKLFMLTLVFVMGTTLFSCQYSEEKKQKIQKIVMVDSMKKVDNKTDSLTVFNTKDSTTIQVPYCPKEEVTIDGFVDMGEINLEEETDISFTLIEEPPRFKGIKKLPREKAKKYFEQRMRMFFKENFDAEITKSLNLVKGKYRIMTQFIIDEKGKVKDVKVRAPHLELKKEILKLVKELPHFIPGKQSNKFVKTKYTLPIFFMVD